MRPLLLRIEGLRSYATPQDIDFRDAELMAIVGDTGAGKSSILEAICFALYGSSSWNEKAVKELISHGMDVMKVRLAFLAEGHEWVVERTASRGAYPRPITKLECAELGIKIDGKREVKDKIHALMGLDYKAFLGAVILPQGRFQQLLQATGRERAVILKGILRLDVLDAMRDWAARWLDERRPQLATLEKKRAKLHDDPETEAERARVRMHELTAEAASLKAARAAYELAHEKVTAAAERAQRLGAAREEVSRHPVDGVRNKLDHLMEVEKGLMAEKSELDLRVEKLLREQQALDAERSGRDSTGLGKVDVNVARSQLARLRELAAGVAEQTRSRGEKQREADALAKQHEECVATATRAERAHAQAQQTLEQARRADAAAHLAADLRPGDHCPVCRQDIPDSFSGVGDSAGALSHAAEALKQAERALTAARKAESQSDKRLDSKRGEVEQCQRNADQTQTEMEQLQRQLPDAVRPEALTPESMVQAEAIAAELERAVRAETARRETIARELEEEREAARALEARLTNEVKLPGREGRAELRQCIAAMDKLRPLIGEDAPTPAAPQDDDLSAMRAYADELLLATTEGLAHADESFAAATAERETLEEQANATLREVGCESVRALHERIGGVESDRKSAKQTYEDASKQIEPARDLDARIATASGLIKAVDELRVLLADGKFVSYAVERKQRAMLAVASRLLGDMTDGRFGFAADFQIVDRRAGEARSADTLSGGETFLASLALALALVELANRSGGRLDALFLDEGFGALDADALEQAVQALMSQAERGRLVAVISHLQAVAENIERVLYVASTPAGSRAHLIDRSERARFEGALVGLLT